MAKLFEYVTSENMIATVVVYIVYLFARSVYRLYWSPLAKFPGPKLTAITGGVEFYHSVIRRGKFVQEIMKMHEQYGV